MLVIASPSGAGKSTLTRLLLQTEDNLTLSVSVTTRPRRASEVDGVHYHFVDEKRFQRLRERGELLEWASVHGNYYGTPREPVEAALAAGKDVLFDVDVAGVMQLSEAARPDMATVFILPPSVDEQIARLKRRASDDDATILRRLRTSVDEIGRWRDFDYVLINDDLDRAFAGLQAILAAERLRSARRPRVAELIGELERDLAAALDA
jgi:guanylate kinase